MGCVFGQNIIMCGVPTPNELRRRIRWCPFEQRNQEMVERFEEWYGFTVYCCGCGDVWTSDDGLRERPLRRNWRMEQVRGHRRLWDLATYGEHEEPSWLQEAAS